MEANVVGSTVQLWSGSKTTLRFANVCSYRDMASSNFRASLYAVARLFMVVRVAG